MKRQKYQLFRFLVLMAMLVLTGCETRGDPVPNLDSQNKELHIEHFEISETPITAFDEISSGFLAVTADSRIIQLNTDFTVRSDEFHYESGEQSQKELLQYIKKGSDIYTAELLWYPSEQYVVSRNDEIILKAGIRTIQDMVLCEDGTSFILVDGLLYHGSSELTLPNTESAEKELWPTCIFVHKGNMWAFITESDTASQSSKSNTLLCEVTGDSVEEAATLALEKPVTQACSFGDAICLLSGDALYLYQNNEINLYTELVKFGIQGSDVVRMIQTEKGLLIAHTEGIAVLSETKSGKVQTDVQQPFDPIIRIAVPEDTSADLVDAAARYNRLGTGYTVEVETFSGEGDVIGLAVSSGEQFDLICNYDLWNMKNYVKSGMLEPIDGMTFLDSDDLFQNIFDIWRNDDSLYYFSPAFELKCVRLPEVMLGAEKLTIERFNEISEELELFRYNLRDGAFGSVLMIDGAGYWLEETSFTDESFIAMLEYCKRYTLENPEMPPISETTMSVQEVMSFFPNLSIDLFASIEWWDDSYKTYYSSTTAFSPLPFTPYEGPSVRTSSFGYIGMCANGNQAGAESFLEYLVSEDYYSGTAMLTWYFPLRKTACHFEGHKDARRMLQLIESADHSGDTPEFISNILWEEINTYFYGQMSATECAQNIQNRVDVYLAEQS